MAPTVAFCCGIAWVCEACHVSGEFFLHPPYLFQLKNVLSRLPELKLLLTFLQLEFLGILGLVSDMNGAENPNIREKVEVYFAHINVRSAFQCWCILPATL